MFVHLLCVRSALILLKHQHFKRCAWYPVSVSKKNHFEAKISLFVSSFCLSFWDLFVECVCVFNPSFWLLTFFAFFAYFVSNALFSSFFWLFNDFSCFFVVVVVFSHFSFLLLPFLHRNNRITLPLLFAILCTLYTRPKYTCKQATTHRSDKATTTV